MLSSFPHKFRPDLPDAETRQQNRRKLGAKMPTRQPQDVLQDLLRSAAVVKFVELHQELHTFLPFRGHSTHGGKLGIDAHLALDTGQNRFNLLMCVLDANRVRRIDLHAECPVLRILLAMAEVENVNVVVVAQALDEATRGDLLAQKRVDAPESLAA